jgi:uncharacterized membrane protein
MCDGQSPAACFQSMGDLPGAQINSVAEGISADGLVVAGGSSTRPTRWTPATGLVPLNTDEFVTGTGLDASGDGSVIVGLASTPDPDRAFAWFNGTYQLIPDLPGGTENNIAFCVSADGLVVVGTGRSDAGEAGFRWTLRGGTQSIGELPGGTISNTPYAVSPDGSVIVGSSGSSLGTEAYRWTQELGLQPLGDLPGGVFGSLAKAVSDDGSVVVGNSVGASGPEFFRWTQSTGMLGLGLLPGSLGVVANACNQDASLIVGGAFFPMSVFKPVVWMEDVGYIDFAQLLTDEYGLGSAIADWALGPITDVSADGLTFCGWGTSPTNQVEAWIVHLPYLPGGRKSCIADISPAELPDGVVNVADLLAVIGQWGACGDPNACVADIAPPGGNDVVNVQDLLAVIGAWGACP